MRWLIVSLAIICSLAFSSFAHAGQMSTYIQGTVLKKTKTYWVVQTEKGKIWINVKRHPSYTRKVNELEIGFWIQLRHLKRVRPNTATAAVPKGIRYYIN